MWFPAFHLIITTAKLSNFADRLSIWWSHRGLKKVKHVWSQGLCPWEETLRLLLIEKKITRCSLPLIPKGKIKQAHFFSNSVRQINLHIMTNELINSLLSCLSNWFLLESSLVTGFKAIVFLIIEFQISYGINQDINLFYHRWKLCAFLRKVGMALPKTCRAANKEQGT